VYTAEDREHIRSALLAAARADHRISGAALTGSAARDGEDSWSDIDLAFGIAVGADLSQTLAQWSDRMYQDHGAVDHVDVTRGATVYRVFLLASTLQVDLAFSPAAEFGARAPTFRLLFGTAAELTPPPSPGPVELVGLGWLHALHARSSIERGRVWQAEYMISGVRDHVFALASLRHGLPAAEGRGVDRLPAEVTAPLEAALVRSLDTEELRRAFRAATEALLQEAWNLDPDLAGRLGGPLKELAGLPL
jgi:predicted nucleotidyltransferase